MNEIAAYGGFPNRYPHWRFGMEYEQLAKSYEYGLSKIYEMVINNNPSYAYLLEGNSLVDQKLVMAHVCAHVDFFKNNFCFRSTDLDTGGRTVDPVGAPRATTTRTGAGSTRWRTTGRACASTWRGKGSTRSRSSSTTASRSRTSSTRTPRSPVVAPCATRRPRRRRRRSRGSGRRTTWSPSSTRPSTSRSSGQDREGEGKAEEVPRARERDVLRFLWITRRSSAGSATCSRSSPRRPSTSCRRCRRRS